MKDLEKIDIKKAWLSYYFPGGTNQLLFRKHVYNVVKRQYSKFWDDYEFLSLITSRVIDKCVLKDNDPICTLKLQVYAQAEFSRAFFDTINKMRNSK